MKIPNWLRGSRKPDLIIPDVIPIGRDYLRRWWIIPRNNRFGIYLHHFLLSDDPGACHDHPYWNISIVIKGRYREWCRDPATGHETFKMRYAGAVVFRRAETSHRVEILDGESAWSIFISGPRRREWGFWCGQRWVDNNVFRALASSGIRRGCD